MAAKASSELNHTFWNQRACLLERAGRIDEALEAHDRAIACQEADGTKVPPNLNLKCALLCQYGRFAEAQLAWLQMMQIPARSPGTAPGLIDLSPFYNASLCQNWLEQDFHRFTLGALPGGLCTLDGVEFDVRGIVQLRTNQLVRPDSRRFPLPGLIPIEQKAGQLHFLHAADMPDTPATRIGSYTVYFAGGQFEEIPITYGRDVSAWLSASSVVTAPVPAWQAAQPHGMKLQLFHTAWTNSHPDLVSLRKSGSRLPPNPPPPRSSWR